MHIHIIQHESFEAPGAYYVWAISRGHEVSFTQCWKGDVLPESMEGIDWLLIMGGPQSPDTTEAECPYFHSQKEQQLIRDAMSHGKIVLGVCLGAQLMGAALGAGVERSPEREVGLVKLYLTEEGKQDPITRVLPPEFVSGAWHGDMPGLTKDSVIL
ncbi:glutamine amidotransferase-related protein, partial [Allisonella histaminiformans]